VGEAWLQSPGTPPAPGQLALQRHAALVEALERRSLAEALLEREYAIFKRTSAQREVGRQRDGLDLVGGFH